MNVPLAPSQGAPPGRTLELQELTVGYYRRRQWSVVITSLSLHLEQGEAYGLVGESGCGKSTVAMAVMRYLPPNAAVTTGRILFQGQDLLRASQAHLERLRGNRMAMVYQDPGTALNPSLAVGRQVAEVYHRHRGMPWNESRRATEAMLATVQIADPRRVMDRYPHELSGGQQQRIMFAMALATDPDLLVLDEPTTGLDATVEAEVLDLVDGLRRKFGASILFISHNLGIVSRMCERVGVLYAGHLVEEGPARKLFRAPRHPYTFGLMRCVPRFDMHKRRHRLEPIPGTLPAAGETTSGCVFAPRCAIVRERCRAEAPSLLAAGPDRTSRCFYHEELATPRMAEVAGTTVQDAVFQPELLRVQHLTKVYGAHGVEITAVEDATLAVGRGEVVGVVGESGSGKTTFAKCVVGLVGAWRGKIALDDADLSGRAESRDPNLRRRLQMVFQNPDTALNPSHTVKGILSRAVKLLGGRKSALEIDARVNELAAAVRLAPRHLELRPASLSGGLKQRVALARAFAGAPTLVVCDEPTSALDVSVQAAILNLLAELQETRQVAYVFISHDLGVVRYLADRIAVMYLGQIIEIGPADATFRPPHHPYTEALLSAVPDFSRAESKGRIRLQGDIPSPSNPPTGCRFHTRCPRMLGSVCRDEEPPWQQDGGDHRYRCHIQPAELREAQLAGPPGATPA
ncbi:MAG: dipeptide ABC transporter ATP-binding protein [Acetobacteraceae bacterium]